MVVVKVVALMAFFLVCVDCRRGSTDHFCSTNFRLFVCFLLLLNITLTFVHVLLAGNFVRLRTKKNSSIFFFFFFFF